MHNKVADFLTNETLGIEDPRDTSQTDEFLEHFQSQITYRDGTYFVPLPWLDNHPPLPSNFNLAHSRLQQVKKRLLKLDLWKPYASIIADQIDKGYVEAIPDSEDPLSKSDAHYSRCICSQCRPCLSERLFIHWFLPSQVIEHYHSLLQS